MNESEAKTVGVSDKSAESEADVLAFRSSPQATLGVELELQIIDRETRDLAPGAVRILKACAEESVEGVTAELMQTMIEVKTGVCRNVAEAREQIVRSLRQLRCCRSISLKPAPIGSAACTENPAIGRPWSMT